MKTSLGNADTVEKIVSFVEEEFRGLDLSSDVKSIPYLACELCEMLSEDLTEGQIKALHAARRFLDQGVKEDADAHVTDLAQRVGKPYPPATTQAAVAKERLLWIGLNRIAELSGYAVEFTLSVAQKAGLAPIQMVPAVQRMLKSVLRE
ncbi:hypothetical protein [Luteibacter sp. CQ10]|uniref:hypothetical protein n=1 Tax=Luteibacter sp. CQ10 TaxID=2805821 RepID=UPI0034A4AABC